MRPGLLGLTAKVQLQLSREALVDRAPGLGDAFALGTPEAIATGAGTGLGRLGGLGTVTAGLATPAFTATATAATALVRTTTAGLTQGCRHVVTRIA